MTDDITVRPEQTAPGAGALQREELVRAPEERYETANAVLHQTAEGVACPYCGTVNDPDALFCASCGKPLRSGTCPNCGSEIDLDADFCEVCHHYIKSDTCSFCGAHLSGGDAYCPECGNPRGGIVCPTCNTLNDFAFCKQCGSPLTDEAKAMVAELRQRPDYMELVAVAAELSELDKQLPYTSERDVVRDQVNQQLRERVLTLLAKDKGFANPVILPRPSKRMSKEELARLKEEKMARLSDILDSMAVPTMPSPVKARNYAMAQKPAGVRLAWVCNYKKAMHSSPCGCAKPHLGGKWVILGKNSKHEIKDDK